MSKGTLICGLGHPESNFRPVANAICRDIGGGGKEEKAGLD